MEKISINDWERFGEGATAESYYHKTDKNLMMKLFTAKAGMELASLEFKTSDAVAALGIATPKILKMVECDGIPAIIYERIIDKKSVSRLCADDSAHIEDYGKRLAIECKNLHSIKCKCEAFESKEKFLTDLTNSTPIYSRTKKKLLALIEKTEKVDTCLHGDMQPGNLVRGWCNYYEQREKRADEEDKYYFIDLGSFSYGNPLYDLGTMYFFLVFSKKVKVNQELFHLNEKQFERLWHAFASQYIGTDDKKELKKFEKKVKPYGAFFILSMIRDGATINDYGPGLLTNIVISLLLL